MSNPTEGLQQIGGVCDNNGSCTIFYSRQLFLTKGPTSGLLFFVFILAKPLGLSTESKLLSILLGQFIIDMDVGSTIPNDGLP